MSKLCKRHHCVLPHELSICPVCEHRSNYLVHGNVDLFDEGFSDGYAGKPNTMSKHLANHDRFEDAASYLDGWKMGRAAFEDKHPAKKLIGKVTLQFDCAVDDCTERAVTTARISVNNRRKKTLPVCQRHADAAKEDAADVKHIKAHGHSISECGCKGQY